MVDTLRITIDCTLAPQKGPPPKKSTHSVDWRQHTVDDIPNRCPHEFRFRDNDYEGSTYHSFEYLIRRHKTFYLFAKDGLEIVKVAWNIWLLVPEAVIAYCLDVNRPDPEGRFSCSLLHKVSEMTLEQLLNVEGKMVEGISIKHVAQRAVFLREHPGYVPPALAEKIESCGLGLTKACSILIHVLIGEDFCDHDSVPGVINLLRKAETAVVPELLETRGVAEYVNSEKTEIRIRCELVERLRRRIRELTVRTPTLKHRAAMIASLNAEFGNGVFTLVGSKVKINESIFQTPALGDWIAVVHWFVQLELQKALRLDRDDFDTGFGAGVHGEGQWIVDFIHALGHVKGNDYEGLAENIFFKYGPWANDQRCLFSENRIAQLPPYQLYRRELVEYCCNELGFDPFMAPPDPTQMSEFEKRMLECKKQKLEVYNRWDKANKSKSERLRENMYKKVEENYEELSEEF